MRITNDDVFHYSRQKLNSVDSSVKHGRIYEHTHSLPHAHTHQHNSAKHFLFSFNRHTPPRSPAASQKKSRIPLRDMNGEAARYFPRPNSTVCCRFSATKTSLMCATHRDGSLSSLPPPPLHLHGAVRWTHMVSMRTWKLRGRAVVSQLPSETRPN